MNLVLAILWLVVLALSIFNAKMNRGFARALWIFNAALDASLAVWYAVLAFSAGN